MCTWYRYSMVLVLRYGTVHCRLYSTFRYRQHYTVQYGTVLYYRYCLYGTVTCQMGTVVTTELIAEMVEKKWQNLAEKLYNFLWPKRCSDAGPHYVFDTHCTVENVYERTGRACQLPRLHGPSATFRHVCTVVDTYAPRNATPRSVNLQLHLDAMDAHKSLTPQQRLMPFFNLLFCQLLNPHGCQTLHFPIANRL